MCAARIAACPWPPMIEQWRPLVELHARRSGVEAALIAAVIWAESGGDPTWVVAERDGLPSVGLMMIHAFHWRPPVNMLLDPERNIWVGASMLADIRRQAGGDVRLSLAAYNCGWPGVRAGRCGRYGGLVYADKVLAKCREFGGCRLVAGSWRLAAGCFSHERAWCQP